VAGLSGPDLKYPATLLGDAHHKLFWSLADFEGGRIIRPGFEISGRNIRPHFWVMRITTSSGP
jgi:hypothetical protein